MRQQQQYLHFVLLGLGLSVTNVLSQTNSSTLPVGSCTPTIPCSNGACCNGMSGFCGFGPDFCNEPAQGGSCTSNCGALAECGPYAAAENITCPLNVCCSQFGFCGTTEEFCATGCQSNCNPPAPRTCDADAQTALQRRIGYYEGWVANRPGCPSPPEMISAETLTHINFAFALISNSFTIIEMTPGDSALWTRTTALKQRNSALKVFLSIGGWSFNDPPTSTIFSQLVSTEINTDVFIVSAISTLKAYSFDGLDIDWEYPAAYDRGGNPADKANYVTFMAALKGALAANNYGLSFTAPSSYWYLQHFDLPGLLQLVNVMTYDLHGTWDGTDPYIGAVVLAHTNLTEIEMTLSLFNNVGINPAQIVLGVGFYGRSFQLADPGCSDPGCPFVGGGAPGSCSASSGTLMFSEIEIVLSQTGVEPVFDETAAVKYVTWDGDQWVSYDDAQTLQMKMNYANSLCLGGTMIWSVDQDDAQYTALRGLYPTIGANAPSDIETGIECGITDCGQNCPAGWTSMTTFTTKPGMSCDPSLPARLCCPSGSAPLDCLWRGGGGTTCTPDCNFEELSLATDPVGDDNTPMCLQGSKAFCCTTGQDALLGCRTSNGPCAANEIVQTTFNTGTGQGSLCCPAANPSLNCAWYGDLPTCLNAACPVGQAALVSERCVVAGASRSYCCEVDDELLPVYEADVLPDAADSLPASFTVDFDDDVGTMDDSQLGFGSSGESDDGQENDSAFGEIFMTSPNPGSVSSLDLASDWVITGCDKSSDRPQQVIAYCSKSMDSEDSGCGHVFIGSAENTIVRMPSTCGLGPYARVVSLDPHDDQSAVPVHIRRNLPENELVYSLKFDYNFAAIPDDNGPVYMRADVTDIPGYWDEIINSPPDGQTTRKREFHQPIELERRWFGPFDTWIKKLTTITSQKSVSRNFHWSDSYTIFHQEESCPNFSSSLDISVAGFAEVNSRFGYYLEATIIPPAIQECYVYVQADANSQATFTVSGIAQAQFGTDRTKITSFGFPGLYYPGELSMGGEFSVGVGYDFPPINLAFGKQDSDASEEQWGSGVDPSSDPFQGTNFNVASNVNLAGNLEAHLIPSLELGLSVLGGLVLDAQVYAEADIYAGVEFTGSVSVDVAPTFCANPYIGVDFNAGLTGSVLFWRNNEIGTSFYSTNSSLAQKCWDAGQQTSKRDHLKRNSIADKPHLYNEPAAHAAHVDVDGRFFAERSSPISKRGVPFVPGTLFCPEVGTSITTSGLGLDCDIYSDLDEDEDEDDDGDDDDDVDTSVLSSKRFTPTTGENSTFSLRPFHILTNANLKTCSAFLTIPAYLSTDISNYYDLANPASLDPTMGVIDPIDLGTTLVGGTPAATAENAKGNPEGVYSREHPYEINMAARFVDYLKTNATQLWQDASGTATKTAWCNWVGQHLSPSGRNYPQYYPAQFGGKSLFQTIGPECFPKNPSTTSDGDMMVVLEQVANQAKDRAFQGAMQVLTGWNIQPMAMRTDSSFRKDCPTKQVSWLRSAAGVTSFLNVPEVRDIFITMNTCIRDWWVLWANAYQAPNSGATPPLRNQVNVGDLYDNWIYDVVAGVEGNIRAQLERLISLYNPVDDPSAHMDLSWPILLEENFLDARDFRNRVNPNFYAENQFVTQDDLDDQVLAAIVPINWLNQLPRH